ESSAIFINAGRGPVVDEQALIAALQNGEIHAAGLTICSVSAVAKMNLPPSSLTPGVAR
ncbi:hypothetical protein C0U44_31400, partial [Klebsiella pneumoniae]